MKRAVWAAGGGVTFSLAAWLLASWLIPLPAQLMTPPSTVVEFRDGTAAYVFLSPDDKWRVPVAKAAMDPAYLQALIRLEDKRFWHHPGVDILALFRAALLNIRAGTVVSGGSTITMQLVRLLEPRPRTLRSKLVECFRAVQLEMHLGKVRILEEYLQRVPYGRNVEGMESASLAYFGHSANHLHPAEICTLLAVPRYPRLRSPSPENAARLMAARDRIAQVLVEEGVLTLGTGGAQATREQMLSQVHATPVPTRMLPFPRRAPHAATWLRAQHPEPVRLRTTLDAGLQTIAEREMEAVRQEMALKGIHNGAVVLVEHSSNEVVALVGNFHFNDEQHHGQVIGFAVPRSPGSALKPFLYAMAIDQGMVGPDHLVPDVPVGYRGYSPKNYDGGFDGLVTLRDALSRSLNVPFVTLLEQLGVETFIEALRTMGVESLHEEPGFYGLSMIVGGAELTPLEVAGLYSVLARDGKYQPMKVLAAEVERREASIFSTGSAWLTRQALSLKDRPDFPLRRKLTGIPPRIHWKTGTSFGHRDAWAAGSSASHTAVVWMGNFDNSASVELVGAEAAGPTLFNLLEAVSKQERSIPEERAPAELAAVEVCAYSGHLPTDACPSRRTVLLKRSAVPTAHCPYHVAVDVERTSGLALNPTCRSGRDYERKTFMNWPASVKRFLKDQRLGIPEAPSLAQECQPAASAKRPTIISPAPGRVVLLLPGVPESQQEIPLEAEGGGVEGKLSWFVNGEFLGTVTADNRLWWKPRPGKHEVLVQDEAAQVDRQVLEVRTRVQ